MSYPAGVDVAFVCQETASQVVVQYLKDNNTGTYSLYDPPYEETRDKSQVLMRLSWPHPKGFTLRELSHLVFNKTELEVAKGKWAAVRANKREKQIVYYLCLMCIIQVYNSNLFFVLSLLSIDQSDLSNLFVFLLQICNHAFA